MLHRRALLTVGGKMKAFYNFNLVAIQIRLRNLIITFNWSLTLYTLKIHAHWSLTDNDTGRSVSFFFWPHRSRFIFCLGPICGPGLWEDFDRTLLIKTANVKNLWRYKINTVNLKCNKFITKLSLCCSAPGLHVTDHADWIKWENPSFCEC